MRRLGLTAQEEKLALGVYFVAISGLQPFPLRLQVQERTEGTTNYLVRKGSKFLPPDITITISPIRDENWTKFAKEPDRKVVFIPEWAVERNGETARLDIKSNQIRRISSERSEGRVVEHWDEVQGAFSCITVDRPFELAQQSRWLTMRQKEEQRKASTIKLPPLSDHELEQWRTVHRLLKKRARVPIFLPEWTQIPIELMCDRDIRAARHVPAYLQTWQTMCLIRSFQTPGADKSEVLHAKFEDLASATLLAKKIFREAGWFPSLQKVFDRIGGDGNRTTLIHPISGKPVVYERSQKQPPISYESLLDWDGV